MTDEQRARWIAADLVKTYGADLALLEGATAAAILTAMQQARREEREAWAAQMKSMAAPKLEGWGVLHTTEREDG